MSDADTFIRIEGLTKKFDDFVAVDNVSFTAKGGLVLGFLGPNGAGKTTTMRMATGFLTPTAGTVSICGYDISRRPLEAKRLLGYLPEGGPLYSEMRVNDFIDFICQIRGLVGAQKNYRKEFVIENLELKSVLNKTIDTLSKGFKRRVGLAQAIIHDPEVLILDEPTDGLDPNQKHEVRKLIKNMAEKKVVIISTHILEEVEAVCQRAVIISSGRIIATGTPDDLMAYAPERNAVVVEFSGRVELEHFKELGKEKNIDKIYNDGDEKIIIVPKKGEVVLPQVSMFMHEKKSKNIKAIYNLPGQLDKAFRNVTSTVE